MITEQQMQEMVQDALPSVAERVRAELGEKVTQQAMSAVTDVVRKEVTKFAEETIAPEIRRLLVESQDGLLAICKPAAEQIVAALATSLTEALQKRLEQTYSRSEIFKTLFSPY